VTDEIDKNYLASLDRRITDHDAKLTGTQRDYTELTHEIKELLNRINNGVSPSVNEVRKENSQIKLDIADLSHKLDITTMEMKQTVRETADLTRTMLANFEKAKLEPVEREVGFMKKTFIYGVVGALIVFVGQKGLNAMWDRVFMPEKHISAPAPAVP
jgi:chromosome segregation ATPase